MIPLPVLPMRQRPLINPGVLHRGHSSGEGVQVVLGPVASRQRGNHQPFGFEIALAGERSAPESVFVPFWHFARQHRRSILVLLTVGTDGVQVET